MSACPPPEKWRLYAEDRLGPGEDRALTEHVQACPACEEALAALVAPGPAPPPRPNSPAPPELVERLRRLWSAACPAADLTAPEHWPAIEGYEILGVLGRGGQGVVYRARQSDLGREVAVKMLAAGERSSPEDARRLLNDARTAAGLRHDHIVPVYAVGQYRGLPYCVMEWVTGGSLAQRVPELVQEPREAARLLVAAARALHYAHQHGVTHRDVKPANILLRVRCPQPPAAGAARPPLGELEACVADFGLARQARDGAGLTVDGAVVGTPEYVAPEQIRSAKPAPAADVYGLGAVLYECLTGRPPFKAATPLDTVLLTLHQGPERPTALNSRLPRDLETVCLKCLEKEPRRRYPSAAALADDLERWLRGEPVQARRVGPLGRLGRWSRRKPLAAALVAALLLALGTGLSASLLLWRRAARNASDALANLRREEAARQETEEHYAMLRQLLTNNVQLSAAWFRPPYEADPLPEAMLADAESCLSHLLRRRPDDLELRLLLADVLTRLGRRKWTADSLALFERAARLWEQVPPGAAARPRHRASRAITCASLGHAYRLRGRLDLALPAFETSFRLWTALAEAGPSPAARDGLYYVALELGQALIDSGRSEQEVLERFEGLRARPGLLGGEQGKEVLLDALRVKHLCAAAQRRYRSGEPAGCLADARQAAAVLGRYYRQASLGRSNRLHLAVDAGVVCQRLRMGEAPAEALRLAELVNRSLQELAEGASDECYLFVELSASWQQIAKAYWQLGRADESVTAHRRAVAAQQQALVLAPTVSVCRRELGRRYLQLGRKLCELGRLAEAEACFRDRQALWPGGAAEHAEAVRELRKWAAQVEKSLSPEKRREHQRYLDLCARLESNRVLGTGAVGP